MKQDFKVFMAVKIRVMIFQVMTLCHDVAGSSEGGGSTAPQNFGILPHQHSVSQPRRQ